MSTHTALAQAARPVQPVQSVQSVQPVERTVAGPGPESEVQRLMKAALPPVVEVVSWHESAFEIQGHDPRSAYVERFWLGLLGPSTTWLLRRFARGLDECPQGFRVDLVETGRALGLGESLSRNSATQRSVLRACQFGAAYRVSTNRLAVRSHLPTLTRRQVARLPENLQRAHERWTTQPLDEDEMRRATAAARGLIAAGEHLGDVERQLRAWGCTTPMARDAARLAVGY